jgi:hypothetical protein
MGEAISDVGETVSDVREAVIAVDQTLRDMKIETDG